MLFVMLGVFLGNWLIFPYFTISKQHKSMYPNSGPSRVDHTNGFFVGLIAAGIVFFLSWFFELRML
jgi:hypothetical protein